MTKARDLANIISGGFTVADLPTLTDAQIPNIPASKITSGTFADARISASSVQAHASSYIDWQSVVTASTLNAVSGKGYPINTTSNTCTITMPSNPSVGDTIKFVDYARNFGTNKIIINPNSKKFQGNTTPQPEYDTNGQSITCTYIDVTQGWIPTVDDDVTFETPQTKTVSFLAIAGGGSGGRAKSGGGGAGGYRASFNSETSGGGASAETALALTPGNQYTITIGAGGSGVSSTGYGNNGVASSISGTGITTLTSIGGGGGGGDASNQNMGRDGGSGGGESGGGAGNSVIGNGTSGQGFNGGQGYAGSQAAGGGGGGAGSAGESITSNAQEGGVGGSGAASTITGSSVTRAGGGAGTNESSSYGGGSGGSGGGGSGSQGGTAGSGTTNTGSGGGGSHTSGNSGAGGSGVVILRIATADYSSTTTGSPSVSQSGGDTIMVFNGSGSYTA